MLRNWTITAPCIAFAALIALAGGETRADIPAARGAGVVGYFPRTATAGQDGSAGHPYEIADADDLFALAEAVANVADARGLCYVQTADIDMDSAGAFPGVGTYAKVPTSGVPFTGTYNGQGHRIYNVRRAGGNTQGVFNQVCGPGVIENLTVENMRWDSDVTGEYGCAIVGNAGGGATLRNLTASGTFGSPAKPSTHNIAGIVVRLCGAGSTAGGAATTIDSCTNCATIYGGYTKIGGICAIVQIQTGFTGKVVFENCANNGALVCKRTAAQAQASNGAVTGNAGIVGYVSAPTEMAGCHGNGVITNADGANTDRDGALVGWAYDGSLADNGGNSAPADRKMIAYYGTAAVTGFKYARLANGVATTTSTLAKDCAYLIEGDVAASGTPVFTLASAGDWIRFDTALGYTFGGTVGAADGLEVSAVVSGTATTYTAHPAGAVFSVTPYVQRPATNAMSVIWFAKGGAGETAALKWWDAGGGAVRGESAVTGAWAVALTNNVASGSDSAVHGKQFKYSYRITGLEPGAAYGYAVELAYGAAYTNTFRTAPGPDSSIRFIYYNDSETQPGSTGAYETWEVTDTVIVSNTITGATTQRTTRPINVSNYPIDQTAGYATNIVRMVERNPDLFVIAGDLAAQGGKQQNWDEFWRHNAGEYNDPAGSIPILAAIGNHDLQDATPKPAGCDVNCEKPSGGEVAVEKYLSYFEVEPNGVDFSGIDSRDRSQMFHRVDYGPATFIFLDTNNGDDYDVEKDTDIYLFRDANCPANEWGLPSSRCPDFNPGSLQYDWLTNNLADAQVNSKFTFVVNHHCPYSVGYHNRTNVTESGEWLSGRAVRALTDTMLRYGVDGWLCGHDEIMEHSRVSGVETLPDGSTRRTVLDVFDMGTAGDGLRGKQITKEANKYEVFRAQKDAPEIYDQNNILVDGGKHYGHMEVNVRETEPGVWTATLEPVYMFVYRDANGVARGFERRVYDDVVVLTRDLRADSSRSHVIAIR